MIYIICNNDMLLQYPFVKKQTNLPWQLAIIAKGVCVCIYKVVHANKQVAKHTHTHTHKCTDSMHT